MVIPGLRAPKLAQTALWLASPNFVGEYCTKRYGSLYTMHIKREVPWVMASDLDDVKTILSLDKEDFKTGTEVLRPIMGRNSLLLLYGSNHMRHRKMVLPAFHGDRLKAYEDIIVEETLKEMETMPRGQAFGFRDHARNITFNVIMRAIFGVDGDEYDRLSPPLRNLFKWFDGYIALALQAVFGPTRFFVKRDRESVLNPLDKELYQIFEERRRAGGLEQRADILSMLMTAKDVDGNPLTDLELRDEIMTLVIAGHETTATATAWAVERLVHTPRVYEKFMSEINEESGEYTKAVVKETLRQRPVLPDVPRRLLRDLELKNYTVPAGMKISVNIQVIHANPELYPDPDEFKPERFLYGNNPPAYAWLPFGGGIRRCVGASFAQMEMEKILTTLFSEAKVKAAGKPERVKRRSITMTPSKDARIILN